MELGKYIKQNRESKNLTQEQLADALHVTRQAVSKWETGNSYPDFETLLELAQHLDLSLDDLIEQDHHYKEKLIKEQKKMTGIDILGICLVLIGIAEIIWSGTVESPSIHHHGYLTLVLGGLFLITCGLLLTHFTILPIKIGAVVITTLFAIFLIYSYAMPFYTFLMSAIALLGIGSAVIIWLLK